MTVHVMLRKADVRSALDWIAIAWLSASIGGPLYVIFGINRVSRRAARLIVDGATGFTGGLNMSAENLADGAFPAKIDDVHFRIHRPVTSQLLSSFADD